MTGLDVTSLPYRPNVGVMLVDAHGRVFTGQRLDRDRDAWQMPQGGVDPNEAPRDAVLRELEEETGVTAALVRIEAETDGWLTYDLPADLIPRLWNGQYRGQKQKWFLMRFLGTDRDINIATEHPEFSAWRWCEREALLDSIVPFKHDVYAEVLRQFEEKL